MIFHPRRRNAVAATVADDAGVSRYARAGAGKKTTFEAVSLGWDQHSNVAFRSMAFYILHETVYSLDFRETNECLAKSEIELLWIFAII